MTEAETSPDVCYRHPNRESWVLCQRCGRTICPECQILSPAGVQCPDCVKELGGSVSWRNAGEIRRPVSKATKLSKTRGSRGASANSARSGWRGVVNGMLHPGAGAPAVTRGVVAAVAALWIVGFFVGNLPFIFGALIPGVSAQVWRFVTAPIVYPSILDFSVILSVVLGSVFFLLVGPTVEERFGRGRFAFLLIVSAAFSGACMVLAGGANYGLTGPLWALFGAYLIFVWPNPQARVSALTIIGFNLLLTIVVSRGANLPVVIGGLIAGLGVAFLFQRCDERGRAAGRTPYLIASGTTLGFIGLALLRSYVL